MKLRLACVALCALAVESKAVPLQCAIDQRTDAHQCIDPSQLRETDGIRWAPLYTGGPKTVRATNFTAHANCRTRVLHLKDRDGVSFGGGNFADTDMALQMGGLLCDTPLLAKKKK